MIQISVIKMDNLPKIELLQAEVDENDQSFFRLLVDGLSIKYITVEPGIYSAEDMCFGPSLASILPKLPTGDWNDGLVAKNAKDDQPYFVSFNLTQLPGVQNIWHGTYVNTWNFRSDESYEPAFMKPNVHYLMILWSPNSLVFPGRFNTWRMKPQRINGYPAIISGPNSLVT